MNPETNRPVKERKIPEYREDEQSGVRRRRDVTDRIQRDIQAEEQEAEAEIARLKSRIEQVPQEEQSKAAVEPRVKARPSISDKFRRLVKKNKFAVAFLAAIGLHYPATPHGQALTESIVEAVKGSGSTWEKRGMVIHPQTEAEREGVKEKIFARGARSNAVGQTEFKERLNARLESGEDVPLAEGYFGLAELAGEDPEKIKQAKIRKDELVEKLAKRMGNDLTDAFIRSVVSEMYGSDANYVWGQGSATEYFLTGKRNCVAIARAEQMVFEELLARLPEENRGKYQLGLAFEKQHEIATLTVLNKDGSVNRTLFLQPPVKTLDGATQETGAPTIPLDTVKKAIASPKPIRVDVQVKAGEKVADSPDIDAITNDPVSLNISVQGPLRGSEYVRSMAEERNIIPVKAVPEKLVGAQELELRNGDEGLTHRYNDETKKSLIELNELRSKMPNLQGVLSYDRIIDNSQLEILESIDRRQPLDRIEFNDIEIPLDWVTEDRFLNLPTREIWLKDCDANSGICERFLNHVSKLSEEDQRAVPLLGLSISSVTELQLRDINGHREPGNLERIALKIDRDPTQEKGLPHEFRSLMMFPAKEIFIKGTFLLEFEESWLRLMGKSDKKFHLDSNNYLQLLLEFPELAEFDNIKPWTTDPVLQSLWEDVLSRNRGHASTRFIKVMNGIRDAGKMFENGFYDKLIY